MRVYHLSAECYPIAKVGGLGDVVGALPKYQKMAGIDTAVALPYYNRKWVQEHTFDVVFRASTFMKRRYEFEILKEKHNTLGFELYLIRVPGLLDREEVYSYPDEREQFIIYQLCFLDWINWSQQTPDLIHCHDHHTGLIPFLLQNSALYRRLANVPAVFTIHNGQYHGAFGWESLNLLPEVDMWRTNMLEWSGGINPLAAAVRCCWKYTTVSPSYLEELKVSSNGLEYLFWLERNKGLGIINGIDTEVWNPGTDKMIAATYTAEKPDAGKNKNKDALCKRFNLTADKPLVSFIGRLVNEKGADLMAPAIERSIIETNGQVNFVVLGTGDAEVQEDLKAVAAQYPDNCQVFIGYNEELSHQIYAGSDFLLMPSRVEPCGLNQLYALRYGTVPVVRTTGGLKDTVIDFGSEGGYGICFENASIDDIVISINRTIELYKNTAHLKLLRMRMMSLDFSWNKSAAEYIQLYQSLTPKL